MPRLQRAEQALKESALESLRDAMVIARVSTRPRLGHPGYEAVQRAMSVWLGTDFKGLSDATRLAKLRAATQWEAERRKRKGPHALIMPDLKDSLTNELAAVFRQTRPPCEGSNLMKDNNTVISKRKLEVMPKAAVNRTHSHTSCKQRTRPKGDHVSVSKAHASLHGETCRHFDHISNHGAVVCSHQRPGDSKPHIDFLLPDGTLDCRFDELCDFLADDGFFDCRCDDTGLDFDFNTPGGFSIRHNDHSHLLVKHGDHLDLVDHLNSSKKHETEEDAAHLSHGDCAGSGCGTLTLFEVGDDELDAANIISDYNNNTADEIDAALVQDLTFKLPKAAF